MGAGAHGARMQGLPLGPLSRLQQKLESGGALPAIFSRMATGMVPHLPGRTHPRAPHRAPPSPPTEGPPPATSFRSKPGPPAGRPGHSRDPHADAAGRVPAEKADAAAAVAGPLQSARSNWRPMHRPSSPARAHANPGSFAKLSLRSKPLPVKKPASAREPPPDSKSKTIPARSDAAKSMAAQKNSPKQACPAKTADGRPGTTADGDSPSKIASVKTMRGAAPQDFVPSKVSTLTSTLAAVPNKVKIPDSDSGKVVVDSASDGEISEPEKSTTLPQNAAPSTDKASPPEKAKIESLETTEKRAPSRARLPTPEETSVGASSLVSVPAKVKSAPSSMPGLRSSPIPKIPLSKPVPRPLPEVPRKASPIPMQKSASPSRLNDSPTRKPVPAREDSAPLILSLRTKPEPALEKSKSPQPKQQLTEPESPVQIVKPSTTKRSEPVAHAASPDSDSRLASGAPPVIPALDDVDTSIAVLRKRISRQKALILGISGISKSWDEQTPTEGDNGNDVLTALPNGMASNDNVSEIKRLADAFVRAAQSRVEETPKTDFVSRIQNNFSRIILRDRAKARKAADDLRRLCHDPKQGLKFSGKVCLPKLEPPDESVVVKIQVIIQTRKNQDIHRRRMLAKEYNAMEDAWRRRLKSVRDKRSKEKRDSCRDRDRYLLVQTRGPAGLLTCKTSSGRTSTKVLPGVTPGGSMNNMAEVDSILADIEQAGGTPGSHHIWRKTLAEIPDQNPRQVPCDTGVLLIDNPIAEVHSARCVNPWTREEKLIFLDKYLLYQKNFRKISSFLDHKDTRDCVRFYFDHKLRYNLKQLLRDSASMKRKGTRGLHLLKLVGLPPTRQAMTRCGLDANASANAFGTIATIEAEGDASPRPGPPQKSDVETKMQHMIEQETAGPGNPSRVNGNVPKSSAVKSETEQLDLSSADRAVFCQALVHHGANWKAISAKHGFFDNSVSKLEDYFNRMKEEFQFLSFVEKHESKLAEDRNRSAEKLEPSVGAQDPSFGHTLKKHLAKNSEPQVSSFSKPTVMDNRETGPPASGEGNDKRRTASWTMQERADVEKYFKLYGREFKKIASLMEQKTPEQVKGYWKITNRQEKSKKRHRIKSNNSSPLLSKDGASRPGGSSSGKKERREAERDSRKRGADDAKLVNQHGGVGKRERLSNDFASMPERESYKGHSEDHSNNRSSAKSGNLTSSAMRSGTSSPKYTPESGRLPLRSKPLPVALNSRPSGNVSSERGRDRARSP